jgi:hypothetical protein
MPSQNWMNSGFNDSSWTSALGAFGTAGITPGIFPNTTWNTGDIWLRRTFTMPTGTFSNLQLLLYHDEDVQIYFNGVLAYSATGYITSYQTGAINSAALAVLTPGATITLAVHCHQTVGGQGVDVGLVNIAGYASASVVPSSQAAASTWPFTKAAAIGPRMNRALNAPPLTSASAAAIVFSNTTWNPFATPGRTSSQFPLYRDEDGENRLG